MSEEREVDELMRHHGEMQERIADEMVLLARNLKENVQASGRIVREDVTVCRQNFLTPLSLLASNRLTWFSRSHSRLGRVPFGDGWCEIFTGRVSFAPCGLRGCKNRPAPFPGRMS